MAVCAHSKISLTKRLAATQNKATTGQSMKASLRETTCISVENSAMMITLAIIVARAKSVIHSISISLNLKLVCLGMSKDTSLMRNL